MEEQESRLLRALVLMARQYLKHDADGTVDTMCMTAGEDATEVLAEYGLMEIENNRVTRWTKAGDDYWKSC